MKLNTTALIVWAWGIVRDAIEGFAHGAIIGSGAGTIATGDTKTAINSALVGGAIGAGKQALLYLNANPIPDVLFPSEQPK